MTEPKDERDSSRLSLLIRSLRLTADVNDLHRRLERRSLRRRMAVASFALALAGAGIYVGLEALLTERRLVARVGNNASQADLPDGAILMRVGSEIVFQPLRDGPEDSIITDPELSGFSLSPDGGSLLATEGTREPFGFFHLSRIWLIDVRTGDASIVAEAADDETFVPPLSWSADGNRISYILSEAFAPSKERPADTEDRAACMLELAEATPICFGSDVLFVAIEPSGENLLVARGLGFPLQVLSLDSGRVSDVVGPSDPILQAAAVESGLGNPSAIQFVSPSWSVDGTYIATWALVRSKTPSSMFFPIVLDHEGKVSVVGRASSGLSSLQWSPTENVLAYTTGIATYHSDSGSIEVRILDPASREDRPLWVVDQQAADPFLHSLVWSPNGEFLASAGRDELRIIDVGEKRLIQVSRPFDGAGELLDWRETR